MNCLILNVMRLHTIKVIKTTQKKLLTAFKVYRKNIIKRLLTSRRDMPSLAGIVTEPNCIVHLWVSPGICTRPRART